VKAKIFLTLQIICYLSIFNSLSAQDKTESASDFPIGVWGTGAPEGEANQYKKIKSTGFNWILMSVNNTTQKHLSGFNVIAQNAASEDNVIYHYSNGKYKKWEAERDEYAFYKTGFKHPHRNPWGRGPYLYGKPEFHLGAKCWATDSRYISYDRNAVPIDSILWGPNYSQEKNYKLHLYKSGPVKYIVNYRLALKQAPSAKDTVCMIYVRYRAAEEFSNKSKKYHELILDSLYITAGEMPGESFHIFTLEYTYPEHVKKPNFVDNQVLTGIEFCLKWYRKGKLFIDYVEVYDGGKDGIWSEWIENPSKVAKSIGKYLNEYRTGWDNIKYWFVEDEPHSMDSYEPFRIVDSLVHEISGKRTITQFHPAWNGFRSGDRTIQKFVELAKPDKVMIDYFPFWGTDGVLKNAEYGFKHLQPIFEQAAQYDPDFFYVPQGFGQFKWHSNTALQFKSGRECGWRYPTPPELKASIFLALAHGSKGIIIWKFATNSSRHTGAGNCPDTWIQWKCIAGPYENNYKLFPPGKMLKDNLNPRLNGKLGEALLTLKFTGDYIHVKNSQGKKISTHQNHDYFKLHHSVGNYYWHAGFHKQNNFNDDNYVLLVNLREDGDRNAGITFVNNTSYENLSARNVEKEIGGLDLTIARGSKITVEENFPAGDGKLYRMSPVIKYGGRLIYDETVPDGTTLYDDMIIENGAILTLNGRYTAMANIIVKDGSINTGSNGELIFTNTNKLIYENSDSNLGIEKTK